MTTPVRRTALAPTLGLTALLALSGIGCGGYGEVSPAAYDFATAMYSIANREADEQLDTLAAKVEEAAAAGELTAEEAQWFAAMVDDARSGDWTAARRAARQMMEDQVEAQPAHPAGTPHSH